MTKDLQPHSKLLFTHQVLISLLNTIDNISAMNLFELNKQGSLWL